MKRDMRLVWNLKLDMNYENPGLCKSVHPACWYLLIGYQVYLSCLLYLNLAKTGIPPPGPRSSRAVNPVQIISE